jgi:hypothetical protein
MTWNSPGDAGWRAAESAVTPVQGQLTAAGLPQRIPRANMVPGSIGAPGGGQGPGSVTGQGPGSMAGQGPGSAAGGQPPGGEDLVPAGSRRSPDVARARLAGFQRGTRRAESAAGSRGGQPADG